MKDLKTYILERSLLDKIDDTLDKGDVEVSHVIIKKYLEDNYKGSWIISEKPNKDGLYEVSSNTDIEVKNTKITSFTNDQFIWTNVEGSFYCSYCNSLKSLEGAPKVVAGIFNCNECEKLKSLEGAPKEIKGSFYCSYCNSLKSLEGAPKEIGGDFNCSYCNSLKSLEGAPKEIGGDFNCVHCKSLESLEGAPKMVGGDFSCSGCKESFTIMTIKKVFKIKGDIYC